MTDSSSVSIPQPTNWQDFERHTRLLFEYSLRDPHTQNNGREGQAQHGVDVYGQRGGGDGPLVGVQCKGKDADYGGDITDAELRAEVKKTETFQPPLKEFILATTAPDDAKIQRAARLLEEEVRASGRDLKISVWGWGRLKQEIVRYREVYRAFHPDATPISDEILNDLGEIKSLLRKQAAAGVLPEEPALRQIAAPVAPAQIAIDSQPQHDALDRLLHTQIDTYRDLIRGRPKTAIDLLTKLKDQVWDTASPRIRFRILANIGAAHHRLAQFDTAAEYFLQAAPFDPDDPIGIANKIAALLIKGKVEDARALASEAFKKFPAHPDISMQRLQARAPGESVDHVWHQLDSSVKGNIQLLVYRVAALREEQNPTWLDALAEAIGLHPDDVRLKAIQAEWILERLLMTDPSAVGREGNEVPTQAELASAAEAFEAMWNNTVGSELHPEGAFAHNAALVRHFLHQDAAAAKLLDAALESGFKAGEAKRLRVSLYMRSGKIAEAVALADTLEDHPQARIIRADLRLPNAAAEARAILANRQSYTDPKDIVAASLVVVDSFLAEAKYEEALKETARLTSLLPNDPQSFLVRYKVKSARGDADAGEALSESARRISDETNFVTRFFVAEALSKANRYDQAVDVLRDHTSTRYDSAALRALIAAAANSDLRAMLRDLLGELPQAILELPFYRNAKIALAIKSGDMKAAEKEIRAYLQLRPRHLELQLQLMHLLFRQNRTSELREQALRPATDFDGAPEDFIKLAQFKDDFGDWHEAHQLAYKTFLANQNNVQVNRFYVGIFLRPGHSKELDISPPAVANDLAVAVRSEDGTTKIYIIEPDPQLRPTPDYLPPGHRVAQALLGRGVGEEIQLPDTSRAKIEWIKPKALHALHEVLNNFQNQFPDAHGLERVLIRPGPDGIKPVLDRVRQRHDATEQVASLYDSGNFPIAATGKMLGLDPVETFVGLISTGHVIRVCVGTHEEREAAFAAIRDNSGQGCVLDALPLHVVMRLGLEKAVRAICGPIGITDATAMRLRQAIHDLEDRIDEPDMTVFWRDGQFYRDEVPPEHKRRVLAQLEADAAWLAANTEVLPAQGTKDPVPAVRSLLSELGSDFIDDILAAEGSGRMLVSEDQALRSITAGEFSVRSSWLQPVLMMALREGHLTREEYAQALIGFVNSSLDFISIDADTLVETLKTAHSHTLPTSFAKLASRLGGNKADMASHLGVAVRTILATWSNKDLSWTVQQAIVGTLLYELSKERPLSHFTLVLGKFAEIGRRLGDLRFAEYLNAWLLGHFIRLPQR